MNLAIVSGNLGRDPELRYTNSNTAVCNFTLASNETYMKDGQKVTTTEWHRVTVWGTRAEACAKYLESGRSVLVTGKLKTSKYTKDGVDHWSTEIEARTVEFGNDRKAQAVATATAQAGTEQFDADQELENLLVEGSE